jgi:hypothetical protein
MAGLSKHSRIIMLKPLLLLQMAGLSKHCNNIIIMLEPLLLWDGWLDEA